MKDKAWITTGLKISSRKKNKLYKRWLKTNNVREKEEYLQYKKHFEKLFYEAKCMYYNKVFDEKVNNMRQIWKSLGDILPTKKSDKNKLPIAKLVQNEVHIEEPKCIAECFNNYFSKVGDNIADALPKSNKSFTDYMSKPLANSIVFDSITLTELNNVIDALPNNKASNDDFLNARLLKEYKEYLSEPLLFILNLSLSSGTCPDSIKIAKVIPLYKKDNKLRVENYRPISLLSILNKVFEKLVYRRLYDFLMKYDVLYKYQFGFRKNYSTSLALIDVLDYCYHNLDKGNTVLALYFDLQKAFDCVDHSVLLHKLYCCGIRGPIYEWLKSYLTNRKQFTVVNGSISNLMPIVKGVPQGSVLGPLLFLLYINDMHCIMSDGEKLKLFADDTNLFLSGKTKQELEAKANLYLAKLHDWFLANKLSLNVNKTCFMIITNSKKLKTENFELIIGNHKITKVSSCRYLGVILDENLKWEEHIQTLIKKLLKFTSIFYKVRNKIPYSCLTKVYYAFVHSHILYGIEAYANTYNSHLNKLQRLNDKLLRILFSKEFNSNVTDVYQLIGSLPVVKLHNFQVLSFVKKSIHCKCLIPSIFHDYYRFATDVHCQNTRNNKLNLFLCSVRNNCGKRNFTFKGAKLWNSLPNDIRLCDSYFTFKKMVKQWLYTNQCMTIF